METFLPIFQKVIVTLVKVWKNSKLPLVDLPMIKHPVTITRPLVTNWSLSLVNERLANP